MRPFHYVEYPAGPTASDVALTYSCFTVRAVPSPDFVHRVWPDGCVSLTFVCAGDRVLGAHLLGVRTRAFEVSVREGVRYWSIRFRPEAGAAWAGVAAAELRDRSLLANELPGFEFGEVITTLARLESDSDVVRLFDAFVTSRALAVPIDETVRAAVSAIVQTDGRRPIASIAADVGINVRSLQRRFLRAVGLTPKEFASVRRGREALKRVAFGSESGGDAWTDIALESGYADQAHMSREFARLTRFTPTALQLRLDAIEHGQIVD